MNQIDLKGLFSHKICRQIAEMENIKKSMKKILKNQRDPNFLFGSSNKQS